MSAAGAPVARFAGVESDLRVRVDAIGACRPPLVRGSHAHEYFMVVLFGDGERTAWHELEGERRPAPPGVLVAVPPGAVHDVPPAPGATVSFMADAINDARPPAHSCWVELPAPEREELAGTIGALARELRERRRGFQAAARAQLNVLLVGLSRLAGDEPAQDPVLRDVLGVIERGFHRPLSLDGIAAQVSRSPRQLTRVVRALTGATVMRLVDERRMQEARRLLRETDAKVEVIARSVGFHDDGYFRRRFRGAHGASPTAWRRGNR